MQGPKEHLLLNVHFAQCKSIFENETRTISFVFEKSILHSKYTHDDDDDDLFGF